MVEEKGIHIDTITAYEAVIMQWYPDSLKSKYRFGNERIVAIKNPISRDALLEWTVLDEVCPFSSASTTKWAEFSTNYKPATTKNTILVFGCFDAAVGPETVGASRQKIKRIGTLDEAFKKRFFALNNHQRIHLENGDCLKNVESKNFEIGTDGAAIGSAAVGPLFVGAAAVRSKNLSFPEEIILKSLTNLKISMENLPFPDEIVLKILSYLNIFDLAKCAQVSKQLMNICEGKEFQQYHEMKEIFKNSTLKLTGNDFITVNITHQEAVKGIKEALKQNGNKIELLMEQERKIENGSRLFAVELYGVSSLK
jgi:hypothetical protein